jgi:hypothetical protein
VQKLAATAAATEEEEVEDKKVERLPTRKRSNEG